MTTVVKLRFKDVVDTVIKVPADVRDVLRAHPVVLAGGAIRDTVTDAPVKDLDVFCRSREEAETVAHSLGRPVRRSLNAFNVVIAGLDVQFVYYRSFEDPAHLVTQFDFRACCAGIYWDRTTEMWEGVCVEGFYEDCEDKRLVFLQQAKDLGSLVPLRRGLKLAAKGWTLPDTEVASVLAHWNPAVDVDAVHRDLKPGYGGRR